MSKSKEKVKKESVSSETKEEKNYPSLVLGLDISTACIGISIVYDDGITNPVIKEIKHIVPKIPKTKKGIEALILRKEIFERDFLSKIKNMGITECVIESPLIYATGNSNAQTVSQLLQFNGLLSEGIYHTLGIVPHYISSYDARMYSFPELLAVRKFNKKGQLYEYKHVTKALNTNKLTLFGEYPFDCDKKNVMMSMVSTVYPDIEWVKNSNGEIKKENYDACDSLICALGYINQKRYGEINPVINNFTSSNSTNSTRGEIIYQIKIWDKVFDKKTYFS